MCRLNILIRIVVFIFSLSLPATLNSEPFETCLGRHEPPHMTLSDDQILQHDRQQSVNLTISYIPIEFGNAYMNVYLAGLRYYFPKTPWGIFYVELQSGKSSDDFYYGTGSTIVSVAGSDATLARSGYSYPFFANSNSVSFLTGGGIEYLALSLNSDSQTSSDEVAFTCPYIEAGVSYTWKQIDIGILGRIVFGNETPEYLWSTGGFLGLSF